MASTIKVNNIQNQCGANIANKCGSTITLGASGDTITLACGASQTGFGRTGTVDWDTTAKTASFTAVSGTGYFVNTTSGAITVTLPASPSAGDIVSIADYAATAATNNITIARNGSNINGAASDQLISKNNSGITLVYVDGTQGWKGAQTSNLNDIETQAEYIVATGGTITCCGDYKIHTFTGPGTFTVCSVGNPIGSTSVEYIVTAGGGGGGAYVPTEPGAGAGGGAGGFRFASSSLAPLCYPAKPLAGSNLPVTAQGYPITVGGGGAGQNGPGDVDGAPGSNSIFSTITSTGGGGTKNDGSPSDGSGKPGGSGGGAGGTILTARCAGSGNTPPTSPPQGNPGGTYTGAGSPYYATAGGGGATQAGESLPDHNRQTGGYGGAGAGLPNAFGTSGENCGSFYYFSGGGGGGVYSSPNTGIGGSGGVGGGGNASNGPAGSTGTANTGGGGGGQGGVSNGLGGAGGSGIVIIRYKYQ